MIKVVCKMIIKFERQFILEFPFTVNKHLVFARDSVKIFVVATH